MPSGGARARSGPPADPSALRRDRAGDAAWTTLPAEGFTGEVPEFPLPKITVWNVYFEDKKRVREYDEGATASRWEDELGLWTALWRKPQAVMWARLGLEYEVAAYVRCYIESTGEDSNSGLKTAALRMAAEIGLSLPGMHSLRWKFAEDEVAAKRGSAPAPAGKSARDRLKVISGG